jgi:hypothetical protein
MAWKQPGYKSVIFNVFAEGTNNTNVGFFKLFRRYEKPWMNGRFRSVNLQLDTARHVSQ